MVLSRRFACAAATAVAGAAGIAPQPSHSDHSRSTTQAHKFEPIPLPCVSQCRVFGVAGDTAGGLGDRVFTAFGETEQAEAMRELREVSAWYLKCARLSVFHL